MKILNLHFKDNAVLYTVTKPNNPKYVYDYGRISLMSNIVVKGKIVDFSSLFRLLRKQFRKKRLNYGNVKIVFSDSQLFKKRVLIPNFVATKDFKKYIDANIENSVATTISDPEYHFEIIESDDKDNHLVMIYAMSKANFKDYQKLMFELRKKIVDFTFESTALIHFDKYIGNKKRYEKKNILLLDVDESQVNLTVFEDNAITYTVVADLQTSDLRFAENNDIYDKKSIVYKIYFEIEKIVNYYNISEGKQLDIVASSFYPFEMSNIIKASQNLGSKFSIISNDRVIDRRTGKFIGDDSFYKLFGCTSKSKQKEKQIKLKFDAVKTYSYRLIIVLFINIVLATLLLTNLSTLITTMFNNSKAKNRFMNTELELRKLDDIILQINEHTEKQLLIESIEYVNGLEIDVDYVIQRIKSVKSAKSKISNVIFNQEMTMSFDYYDNDVSVMKFIRRLENEDWVLDVKYPTFVYMEDSDDVSVMISISIDRASILSSKVRGGE